MAPAVVCSENTTEFGRHFAQIPHFLGAVEQNGGELPYPYDRAFGALVARFCDPPLAVPEGGQSFGSLSETA